MFGQGVHNLFPGENFVLYFLKLKFTLILSVHFTKSGVCFVHQIGIKKMITQNKNNKTILKCRIKN